MTTLQGTRITSGQLRDFEACPGAYGKLDGEWLTCLPTGDLCSLHGWAVTEHADGTITASPSILMHALPGQQYWHGYLERGMWREV